MTTVRKLIDEKAETKIYTIQSSATVFDALQVMCEGNTGAVLVTEQEKIVGIFTERDYAREGEVKGRTLLPDRLDVLTGATAPPRARRSASGSAF